jgi:hypothetical protein
MNTYDNNQNSTIELKREENLYVFNYCPIKVMASNFFMKSLGKLKHTTCKKLLSLEKVGNHN